MKILKFTDALSKTILTGEKTSTLRLFDDKDLQVGDKLQLVNKDTSEVLGGAIITGMQVCTLGTLTGAVWSGQERFRSEDEMYATFQSYYGDGVNSNTEVKIIMFNFKK